MVVVQDGKAPMKTPAAASSSGVKRARVPADLSGLDRQALEGLVHELASGRDALERADARVQDLHRSPLRARHLVAPRQVAVAPEVI